MIDRARRAGLAKEARARGGVVVSAGAKQLDRDASLGHEVDGRPHHAHAALSRQLALEPVPSPDDRASFEGRRSHASNRSRPSGQRPMRSSQSKVSIVPASRSQGWSCGPGTTRLVAARFFALNEAASASLEAFQ